MKQFTFRAEVKTNHPVFTFINKNKNRKYYGLYNCIFRNKAL